MSCLTACLTFIFGTESGASSAAIRTPSERRQTNTEAAKTKGRRERRNFTRKSLSATVPFQILNLAPVSGGMATQGAQTSFGLILSIFAQQLLTAESARLLTCWVILM